MDKAYDPKQSEEKTYAAWESGGYFQPVIDKKKKPFSVILPPPNANADLHLGHAMYVIEDIMIRYHRMNGYATLWLSGADHAGFETQYVFEKFLAKQGKSRFDFTREDLYKAIWDFVQNNRSSMENQLRRLGFSLDWTRKSFPLDPEIISTVYVTFKKLYDDGFIYRGSRLVNYCTKCGTGFSDLEVKHVEQTDPLYYMKYGPFILATVRPETKFGDTAVAVNPHDKRYKDWIGKEIDVEGLLGTCKIIVVGDDAIDPDFGTGIAKVTPAHDFTDYEIAKRHNLPLKQVIGFNGRLTDIAGPYAGMKVKAARIKVAEDLASKGLLDHIEEKYVHTVSTCYKCASVLEPLPMEQWFVKVEPLAKTARVAVENNTIKFVPGRFKKAATQWLTDFHDWNISRQIVWGIRIPAWQCTCGKWMITDGQVPVQCPSCKGNTFTQDSDVFDTWFSSGQWPFATLKQADMKKTLTNSNDTGSDFEYFYPTSVMETGYDILPWWVCRMMMLGLYATGKVPFKTVYLHGLVRDGKGQKMSKSKGNVINPLEMIEKYGCDALRMSLVFGTAAGNDQSLSEDKIRGMRNFANKLWNIGRLFMMNIESLPQKGAMLPHYSPQSPCKNEKDAAIINDLNSLIENVTKDMERFRFSDAAQGIYDFTWHRIADTYLEENKERFKNGDEEALSVFRHVLLNILKLLHPFMPFVTETLWGQLPKKEPTALIVSPWPEK